MLHLMWHKFIGLPGGGARFNGIPLCTASTLSALPWLVTIGMNPVSRWYALRTASWFVWILIGCWGVRGETDGIL